MTSRSFWGPDTAEPVSPLFRTAHRLDGLAPVRLAHLESLGNGTLDNLECEMRSSFSAPEGILLLKGRLGLSTLISRVTMRVMGGALAP